MQSSIAPTAGESEFTSASIGAAVAAAAGLFTSVAPIVVSTFSVFLATFVKEYGWGRGSASFAITISAIVGGAVTPFAGRALDRFGIRRVMLPAVALFGLSVMSVALADGSLWQLYAFYALIGITAGFQNMVAYFKVASIWFHRHRGRVLSLVSACYGIAGATMPKIVQPLVADHGWRAGYLFLGCVALSSLIVLVPLLRLPPGTEGLSHAATTATGTESQAGITSADARRTRTFWILFIVLFLAVMSLVGTLSQIFPMMLDRGIEPSSAATVLAVFYLGSMTGQLSYGFFVDRIDSPRAALPFFTCALIGATTLHNVSTLAMMYPAAYLAGIGHGAELGLAAYFTGRYFGVRHLGAIYGLMYAGATLASGIGPLALGYSYDLAGSYRPMMIAFEVALLLATLGIAMLGPYIFGGNRAASGSATAGGETS